MTGNEITSLTARQRTIMAVLSMVAAVGAAPIALTTPAQTVLTRDRGAPSLHIKEPHASEKKPAKVQSGASALPALAQARISAAVGEDDASYHALGHRQGFRLTNKDHAVSAEFTPAGVEFRQNAHGWGLALHGYGYGSRLHTATAVPPHARANRVEYRRGALTEWYVNGPLGLEQGFTLKRAPGAAQGEPLTIAFALSGELTPSLDAGRQGLTLNQKGAAVLRYGGLTAWDATGRELQSWLDLKRDQLRVHVNDAGAQYPLTIDPYVQAIRLTTATPCQFGGVCDDGGANHRFGSVVAMSGDASTIVVASIHSRVYVFSRPSLTHGGWNSMTPVYFGAKLTRSDTATGPTGFGAALAISHDGSTIVVSAPGGGITQPSGAAYVYVKPAQGWNSSTPLMQTAKLTGLTGQSDSRLGHSLAISADGKIIAAGAPGATYFRVWEGAVYVYLKPAAGWLNSTENQRLTLYSNAVANNFLGTSIAISADGKTIVAGAPNWSGGSPGAAWVFTAINPWGTVSIDAKLVPTDLPGSASYRFARTVAMSADGATIAVGRSVCITDPCDGSAAEPAAAYVYTKPGSSWASAAPLGETAKLTGSDSAANGKLGASMAVNEDGSIIASTAPLATYVFVRPTSGWTSMNEAIKVLTASAPAPARGVAMAGDGHTIAVGVPSATVGSAEAAGAVYVSTGEPTAPIASLSPSSLTFASQPLGATATRTVTVANTGTAPLYVSHVNTFGPFTTTQNCISSSPLAPGGTCLETVSFRPTVTGSVVGTLFVWSDSRGVHSAESVYIQGDAVKAPTSTAITSIAPTPVNVNEPVMLGFAVLPQTGLAVPPSGTVTVKASTGESCFGFAPAGFCAITFTTAADRTLTAEYTGDSNFTGSISPGVTINMPDFHLQVLPSSQTVTGEKATYTVTITPLNEFTGNVSLRCAGGPAHATCDVSPAVVSVRGSAASARATVAVPKQAKPGTYTVTITGHSGATTRSSPASLTVK